MQDAIKQLFAFLSLLVFSINALAIGYPDPSLDLGQRGDFLIKVGTAYGRTTNLTNIGPYIINLPESPGSTAVALPNNEILFHDTAWDFSDLTNPQMIRTLRDDAHSAPILAHATVIRFDETLGPLLYEMAPKN